MHIRMLSSSTVTPPMIGVKSWQTEPNVLLCQLLQTGRTGQRRCAQRIEVRIFLGWSIEFSSRKAIELSIHLDFRKNEDVGSQQINVFQLYEEFPHFTSKRKMGKHDLQSALG